MDSNTNRPLYRLGLFGLSRCLLLIFFSLTLFAHLGDILSQSNAFINAQNCINNKNLFQKRIQGLSYRQVYYFWSNAVLPLPLVSNVYIMLFICIFRHISVNKIIILFNVVIVTGFFFKKEKGNVHYKLLTIRCPLGTRAQIKYDCTFCTNIQLTYIFHSIYLHLWKDFHLCHSLRNYVIYTEKALK